MSLLRALLARIPRFEEKTREKKIVLVIWFFFETNQHATEVDRETLWPMLEEAGFAYDFIARWGTHFSRLAKTNPPDLIQPRRGHFRLSETAKKRMDLAYGELLREVRAPLDGERLTGTPHAEKGGR